MKNTIIKNLAFGLLILTALAACSEKNTVKTGETTKADSTATAKTDSVDAAEAKDVKEALDVVKK